METSLKRMGFKCAFVRTLILGVSILFFINMTRDFWYRGLNFVLLYVVIILILSIALVYTWVCAFQGGPFRAIRKYCNQSNSPKEAMQRLEKAWATKFATQNCLVSEEYFIWARKLHAVVIPISEIYGISYEESMRWNPDTLRIYLKDNTFKLLSIRGEQGLEILEHIEKTIPEIVIGEKAALGLQKTLVGKINIRYRIVKIQERFFIVDYADPGKLSSYLSLGAKFRFDVHKKSSFWRAYEVPAEELRNIKYKPLKAHNALPGGTESLVFAGSLLGTFLLTRTRVSDLLPIQSIFGIQFWVVILILVAIFLIFFFFINIASKFETDKYVEVRIFRKKAFQTKTQLLLYVVLRALVLMTLLYPVVMMFIWNVGVLLYALFVLLLMGYIFAGVLMGFPTIYPRANISVLYKKVKRKDKRRIVNLKAIEEWKENNADSFELGVS